MSYFGGRRDINFEVGESLYVKDFRNRNEINGKKGIIHEVLGPRSYLCQLLDNPVMIWKRHVDQIVNWDQFFSEHCDKIDSDNKPQEFKVSSNNDVKKLPGRSNLNLRSNAFTHQILGSSVEQEANESYITEIPEFVEEEVSSEICLSRPKRYIKPSERLNL